ncbi:MAG: methylmalonyl Co-A mutase-associated GTPase MeaB [Sorangiineae bacterium]|nr:methylmalonyl Co-A mutase-associated GTPase MeaB [Polyangiaceae bacterium]MEB2322531.1 methylmalonyl Co-A mutase-associated GTPase MeaB [Sorangiineae bacterium]
MLPAELASGVARREPRAVARAISLVEDRREEAAPRIAALLGALPSRGGEERVGITGPPGVGKSSLVSALARVARASGRTVGVLAVDPSSPRSGGALLGDRARIELEPDDTGLFVRSMASGGALGGLASAAGAAIEVLAAAYDLVLIETTGVGQSETDVEHVADTVVMVVQPASGDVLQFLKSGIIEIPDVFVVNKADLGEIAARARAELAAALDAVHAGEQPAWRAPVISTSVPERRGFDELLGVIDAHRAHLEATCGIVARRRRAAAAWSLRLFLRRYGEVGVERAGGASALRARFERELAAGRTAFEAVRDAGRP